MNILVVLAVIVIIVLVALIVYLVSLLNAQKEKKVSEEEICDIVADNEELRDDEKRMIHEIIDLGDATVREIMTPRVDMIFAEDTETVRETIEHMRGTGFSRLPVYHEDVDHIVGIVHYKDLVNPLLDGKEDDLVLNYAHRVMFVPETKDVYALLTEMQTNHQQMAIVVDEYGGTDGLITIEDIVEEIVGEIEDESDHDDESLVSSEEEGVWTADGRLPIDDAQALGWPVKDSEDYETLAGWVLDLLDTVPQVGDEFELEGYRFRITAMRRRRIRSMRVERLEQEPEAQEDAEDEEEKIASAKD